MPDQASPSVFRHFDRPIDDPNATDRVRYLLSATLYYRTPNLLDRQTNQLTHECVVRAIVRQTIAKLEECASSFPGERA